MKIIVVKIPITSKTIIKPPMTPPAIAAALIAGVLSERYSVYV